MLFRSLGAMTETTSFLHTPRAEARRRRQRSYVRLAPGEADAAVDDRGAVAVDGIGAGQEADRAQRHVVRRARLLAQPKTARNYGGVSVTER